MIRLRELTLEDAKNTRRGTIRFRDLPSGASVTGIYGQNGSGKTTVIDAIHCLKLLMEGRPLGAAAVGFIRRGSLHATITALFDMGDDQIEYAVTLELVTDTGGARVMNETLTLLPGNGRRRLLVDHGIASTADELGLRGYHTLPRVRWRSIRSTESADDLLSREETLSWDRGGSLLFSPETTRILGRVAELTENTENLSRARATAVRDNLLPTLDATRRLASYARDCMRIITTRNGSSISFDYAPLTTDGAAIDVFDISRPVVLPVSRRDAIRRMVAQADRIMPALVHGLHIACDMTDARLDDGSPGVKVFLRSVRDGVSIPLWAESEGVRRIMGILGLLVRMFNEEDVLVAVDEIDSGVYEILLGDLLATLASRGVGQLVFTAHNLRVLEALDPASIVFSTIDPDDRFTMLKARDSNNLRDMYIRAVKLRDHDGRMADRVDRRDIAMALYEDGAAGGEGMGSDDGE